MSLPNPRIELASLTRGLSVYQDVALKDGPSLPGARDCEGRWRALEPHLPPRGVFLDVGSNFGWFGLQIVQSRPEAVVISAEADLRSARVQQAVLRSHAATRVVLVTRRAGSTLAGEFSAVGQRFDAVLCLSVLHWMADHRAFLTQVGAISGRLLIESADPREHGAGVERIRREIGMMGPYLESIFPDRVVRCVGQWAGHRDPDLPRQLWLVEEPAGWVADRAPCADAQTLLGAWPAWPPRSWWSMQLQRTARERSGSNEVTGSRIVVTAEGLAHVSRLAAEGPRPSAASLRRRLWRVPEYLVTPWWRAAYLALRSVAGTALRRIGCRP